MMKSGRCRLSKNDRTDRSTVSLLVDKVPQRPMAWPSRILGAAISASFQNEMPLTFEKTIPVAIAPINPP